LAGTCCSFGGYPLRKRPSPSGGESVTPSLENGQVPLGENQSPRVSTTAEFLRRRISDPEFRQRPSSSGGESVTPSFDNGRVPLGENQSPRVSTTAEFLRRRISDPEFRQRPSPSGGESVTPSFENGQVHPGEKIDFDHVRLPPFSLPRLATDAYGYVEQENRQEGAGNNWVSSENA
jgi:hypothetical protein